MEADVAVVGAGAAGIAAARALKARGLRVVVLEAGARPGGRAFTESTSLGAAFDHGASWLHDAEVNPLSPLARQLGFTVLDQGPRRKQGLRGSEAERVAYLRAIEAAEDAFEAAAQGSEDRDCLGLVPQGPWRATVAHWLGNIINGASLAGISVKDYVAIDLHGSNWQVEQGLGTLLARLAEGLDIRLSCAVRALDARGPGVVLETAAGTLRARGCIVTVSTAVLASGAIRFTPALPVAVQGALHGLPLGLLSKVAMRCTLDVAAFTRCERRVAATSDNTAMTFILRPFGRDHVIGFIGGDAAWALAREGEAAAEALLRAELAHHLGAAEVQRALHGPVVTTRWAQDPLFLGAYTHARVGAADARRVLREAALAGGALRFAGEACHPTHAATLGGAWESGELAANTLVLSG